MKEMYNRKKKYLFKIMSQTIIRKHVTKSSAKTWTNWMVSVFGAENQMRALFMLSTYTVVEELPCIYRILRLNLSTAKIIIRNHFKLIK